MEPTPSTPNADIFRELILSLEKGEAVVLTTVIRTDGSTPQKPGAKLLVRRDGSMVGTLGGGCVENDLRAFALDALREGKPAHLRQYVLNEPPSSTRGMVCGGRMEFLIDPLCKSEVYVPFGRAILEATGGAAPLALCCVTKAPEGQRCVVGQKLLVCDDGSCSGSIGNREADSHALEAGRRMLTEKGEPRCESLGIGVEYFIEAYYAPPLVAMLGGGHIAKALEPLAKMAGLRFCVVDDRPDFGNRERFATADGVLSVDFGAGLGQMGVRDDDFVVVATRGHRFDDIALEAAVRSPARYVGLLGSRRKVGLIFASLMKKGIPRERVMGIHAPIGLDIGGRTPEEIAISIMAEIIMVRRGGAGQSMMIRSASK